MITVYVPSEIAALIPGDLERGEEESDERYALRQALFEELMSIEDKG